MVSYVNIYVSWFAKEFMKIRVWVENVEEIQLRRNREFRDFPRVCVCVCTAVCLQCLNLNKSLYQIIEIIEIFQFSAFSSGSASDFSISSPSEYKLNDYNPDLH